MTLSGFLARKKGKEDGDITLGSNLKTVTI